ncbi:type II secretion system protein GspL [Scandinavium goeteborgense]|uniref:Type II secretion system protein L n=1 Tax=Scandinavium goeteborgense TaxID=1851514 RepID=A0A4R6DVA1_SCAGO|nr:type II secretion system protein GspL [Scandinavium goeteborgense]TDN48559.1 type II secretion system protein L (GspL) [Scandinavium goeteborgense]
MKKDLLVLRLAANTLECSYHSEHGEPVIRQFIDLTEPDCLRDLPGKESALLLLCAEHFYFREVTLPVEDYTITTQTLGWLAEDTVTENPDDLHWSILARNDDRLHLAGLRKAVLTEILLTLSLAGVTVRRAIPDGYDLPFQPQAWTLHQLQDRWLLRYAEHKFSVLNTALLEHLLMRHPTQKLLSFTPLPVAHASTEILPAQERDTVGYHPPMTITDVNLLHGPFRVRPAVVKVKPFYRKLSVGALVLAIFVWLSVKGLFLWQVSQQNAELKAQGKALWSRYFPADTRSSNFKFFFESASAQTWPDVMSRLSLIAQHLHDLPKLKIRQFAYDRDKHALTLTLKVEDPGQMAQFIQRTHDDFNFSVQPSDTAGLAVLISGVKP